MRVARTEREAVAAALGTRPGLILADIQLADGDWGSTPSMRSCRSSPYR